MDGSEEEAAAVRSASSEASRELQTLIDKNTIESLKQTQHLILGRLQDSNAVLSHFNEFSQNCFADVMNDFSRNTRLLKSMKADLDHVFLKLRSMRSRLMATYPDAFARDGQSEVVDDRPDLEVPVGGWDRHDLSGHEPGSQQETG